MSCSTCKSDRPVNRVKWVVIISGLYILVATIYGTIEIFNKLVEFFK